MKQNWWRSTYNQNQLVFKLGISILFIGFGFRLLFSESPNVSYHNYINTSVLEKNEKPIATDLAESLSQIHPKKDDESGKCDIFDGEWVPNLGGAPYTNNTCRWIGSDQNCMTNGRPDTEYINWRWKLKACELPRFDAKKFLEMMRDKSWAFVGDSITRNHLQSFICLLTQVEDDVEIFHNEDYKNQKWHFPSYNLTVTVIWSPFLAKADNFEDTNHVSSSQMRLHVNVDVLDKIWTEEFHTWDYVLFSTGIWFNKTTIYYENNTILGCYGCVGKNYIDLGINFAYQKVIKNLFDFIINSDKQSMILYRTSTPDHFENGSWSSGGTCDRRVPAKEGEFEMGVIDKILRDIELLEFAKAEARASKKGKHLKLLDVMPLSFARPDGHPGPYSHLYPFAKDKKAKVQYDCLHW